MVASFVSRANSGYTNRSDDRKSMASLASMMSGRVRLQGFAVLWAAWAAREHPSGQLRVGSGRSTMSGRLRLVLRLP